MYGNHVSYTTTTSVRIRKLKFEYASLKEHSVWDLWDKEEYKIDLWSFS